MAMELFQEGGPLNAKKSGADQYSMSVAIPGDEDGRIARECPNEKCSPGYFKVKPGTGMPGGQSIAYCPYCQSTGAPSNFTTKEQVRYAKDLVAREAKVGIERAMKQALGLEPDGRRKLGGGLFSISVEMRSAPPKHVWQPHEALLQRNLVCPHCTLDHSVYGFAIWCPDCGKDIFTSHVRGEIRVIEAIVGEVDRRRRELGPRVAARHLENALEDLVSIFEATLKMEMQRFRKTKGDSEEQIDVMMKRIGSRLQSVTHAVAIVAELCEGILLFTTNTSFHERLNRVFLKRHPITHNLGVVDRKYLEKVRSGEAEGTEVRVYKDEVLEAARIVDSVIAELHRKLFASPF